jgi:hypothetical protein
MAFIAIFRKNKNYNLSATSPISSILIWLCPLGLAEILLTFHSPIRLVNIKKDIS